MLKQYSALLVTYIPALLFVITFSVQANEQFPLRFGSVAQDTPAVMYKRLEPLTEYLSKTLNRPVELNLSPNMGDAINKIATNKVDVTYLTPVAYLKAHEKGNSKLIAKMVTNNHDSFQLMIVVKENSSIKSIQQLAGKKFAFGDKKALLQRATVVGAGLPLEKLGSYEFIGHYNNIAKAVIRGVFDAGIVKDTTAFKWKGKGLRILYSSPQMPPYNITVSSTLSKTTLDELSKAFLQLDINNPEHRRVIKSLGKKYDGFVATNDAEYDVVRELIKPFTQ